MSAFFLLIQTLFSLNAIDVGKMEMQNGKVVMEEGLLVKQAAGTFQADRGVATLDSQFFPVNIDFQGNVSYSGEQEVQLKCPFISIDCKAKEAFCHGTDVWKVEYSNTKEGVLLNCKRMELHFREQKPHLWKIVAEEELEIQMQNGEKLIGAQAILQRDPEGNSVASFNGPTMIHTPAREEIIAESVQLDLNEQKARLEGKTVVKLPGDWKRVITAYGPVLIGNEQIVIESPVVEGKVPEEQQVSLQDERGEVFADRAELSYSKVSGKLTLQKLILRGNVRLVYNSQIALADEGELDFNSRELRLKALSRNSVLFYDRLNRMQAGAKEMIVRLNPQTGEPSVKGVGVMRLVLKEEEFLELKNRFSAHGL